MTKKERPFDPDKPVQFRDEVAFAEKGTKVRVICKDMQMQDGSKALCIGVKPLNRDEYVVLRGADGKQLSRTGTEEEGISDLVNIPQSSFVTLFRDTVSRGTYLTLSHAIKKGKNLVEKKPLGVLEQDEDGNFLSFHPWEELNE